MGEKEEFLFNGYRVSLGGEKVSEKVLELIIVMVTQNCECA